MLQLRNIKKDYMVADTRVHALKGIDLEFRESEFVAILGHSGCGKTTLLNIIGGLDRFSAGDLIINGRSTKKFTDADWDAYRNHSIGFVFQAYNLIPHQTVLANVELALTISGVPHSERRRRADAQGTLAPERPQHEFRQTRDRQARETHRDTDLVREPRRDGAREGGDNPGKGPQGSARHRAGLRGDDIRREREVQDRVRLGDDEMDFVLPVVPGASEASGTGDVRQCGRKESRRQGKPRVAYARRGDKPGPDGFPDDGRPRCR